MIAAIALWLSAAASALALIGGMIRVGQWIRSRRARYTSMHSTNDEQQADRSQDELCTQSVQVFTHATGRFQRRTNGSWDEYDESGRIIYHFDEISRDNTYLYLKDSSRRKDPGRPFILRLPLAGGIAQWSWPNPYDWSDLTSVRAGTSELALATTPTSEATIMSPGDGTSVSHAVVIEGTVTHLRAGMQIWVVTEPSPGMFHPQAGPAIVDKNRFRGTAYVGNAAQGADAGRHVKIHIVLCPPNVGQVFANYIIGAASQDAWVGLPPLQGTQILTWA